MITLICTNCRTEIEMDDAFAGGVCRCKHCGTIQTVPSGLKSKSAKSLYTKPIKNRASTGSGLDDLANAVASTSSGLSESRLRAKTITGKKSVPIPLIAVVLTAIIIAGGIWFFLNHQNAQAGPSGPGLAAPPTLAATPETLAPNFCDHPIDGNAIVYLLDRGSATAEWFSYLKQATFASAQTLGRDRKFQIIFWNNGSEDAYPSTGLVFATPQNIEAGRHVLDAISAHGQSDVQSALVKAIAQSPDAIILATGKGDQLDDDFATQVLRIRGNRGIKIYTFDVGGSQLSPPLQTIANRSGAQAQVVSAIDLKKSASE
jgi:hypothetical protein